MGWTQKLPGAGGRSIDGHVDGAELAIAAARCGVCALVVAPLSELGFTGLAGSTTDDRILGHALLHALQMWLCYLAVEPYVRRLWPRMLVGWARLVSGRLRDPLVGNAMHLMLIFAPLTLDPSSWYIDRSLIVLGIVAAVVGYGFYASLAGRPLLRDAIREPAPAAR